jgi:hypothetical protein
MTLKHEKNQASSTFVIIHIIAIAPHYHQNPPYIHFSPSIEYKFYLSQPNVHNSTLSKLLFVNAHGLHIFKNKTKINSEIHILIYITFSWLIKTKK